MVKLVLIFKMKKNILKNKGFTLIELLVSTSIFVIIMLSAMGSLFILLNGAKNSRALRFSVDNVNYAMESISRSIRMGTNYYCLNEGEEVQYDELEKTKDCPGGGSAVAFIPQTPEGEHSSRIGYIWKKREDSSGTKSVYKCSPGGCVEIVSGNVDVQNLRFFVNGAEDEERQASVYIIMKGIIMVKDTPIPFALQTLASMRNF